MIIFFRNLEITAKNFTHNLIRSIAQSDHKKDNFFSKPALQWIEAEKKRYLRSIR